MTKAQKPIIYQAKNGALELRGDLSMETIWATQKQMAEVFGVNVRTISEHIKNIYKTDELRESTTIRKFRIVQKEGKREVSREIDHYNLDMVISVGYRVNSRTATKFRQWATKVLKQHVTKGYTINKKALARNQAEFLRVVEDIKALSASNQKVGMDDVLELVKAFSGTWFSLQSYDEEGLPRIGSTKRAARVTAEELGSDVAVFKQELMHKGEATEMFAQEKNAGALDGIVGNVLQSVFGKDAYGTLEEKAAHLLYFMVKNHPFTDGNKRTGAFAFVWFLGRTGVDFTRVITPETLTTLTLLIAESDPHDKDRMIGLVLLLLKK